MTGRLLGARDKFWLRKSDHIPILWNVICVTVKSIFSARNQYECKINNNGEMPM